MSPAPARITTLEAFPGQWCFANAAPDADLASAVVEFWEVEGRLTPFRERVLPNGFLELMINLGGPHQTVSGDARTVWLHSWFSGLHERSIEIESEHGTHLVSARLHPLGAMRLFGVTAPEAANRVVDLRAFLGDDALSIREALGAAEGPAERFALLERFLRPRFQVGDAPPDIVASAVRQIEAAHGNLQVSTIHDELGVSRKHLTVQFTRAVGLPPKSYAQIQRFVWTLARLRESETVDWAQLAANAGYSDQSHLVRDFRRVADASPTEFVRAVSPDGTALLEEMAPVD